MDLMVNLYHPPCAEGMYYVTARDYMVALLY